MSSGWDMFSEDDITSEHLTELKAQYGPIFKTEVEGRSYYFRTLTRREAVELGLIDGFVDPEIEEAIFQRALVYPSTVVDFERIPAGAPSRITQEILARSGLAGAKWLNEYLGRARAQMTAYHTIAATICTAFPSLLPGSLDDLNINQLMDMLAIAEEILDIRARVIWRSYAPLEFQDNGAVSEDLTDEDRDAMVRAMLSDGMQDVPSGWIDKTKKIPQDAKTRGIPNPSDGI